MTPEIKTLVAAILLTVIAFMAAGAGPPTPVSPPVSPLTPVTSDPLRVIWEAPVVTGADGQERQQGLVGMIVSQDFNTGVLANLNPRVELIEDKAAPAPLDARSVYVRVPDEEIDAFVMAAGITPGVRDAGKQFMLHLDTYDPHWNGQYWAGLSNIDLDGFWDLLGMGMPAVRVAVIDGGVTEVPDLRGNVEAGHNTTYIGSPDDYRIAGRHVRRERTRHAGRVDHRGSRQQPDPDRGHRLRRAYRPGQGM